MASCEEEFTIVEWNSGKGAECETYDGDTRACQQSCSSDNDYAGASVTTTNFDFSWTLPNPKSGGKVYYAVTPRGATPTAAQVQSGAGAICSQGYSQTANSMVSTPCNLQMGVTYDLWAAVDDNGNGANVGLIPGPKQITPAAEGGALTGEYKLVYYDMHCENGYGAMMVAGAGGGRHGAEAEENEGEQEEYEGASPLGTQPLAYWSLLALQPTRSVAECAGLANAHPDCGDIFTHGAVIGQCICVKNNQYCDPEGNEAEDNNVGMNIYKLVYTTSPGIRPLQSTHHTKTSETNTNDFVDYRIVLLCGFGAFLMGLLVPFFCVRKSLPSSLDDLSIRLDDAPLQTA